jgi:predicted metal-dependent HD superfamily phosphohydrolase
MYFDISITALQLLVPLYNSPQRHYHNLSHIHYCLSKFDEYKSHAKISQEDEAAALYAIWFHDAVYSPFPWTNTSNEKESALIFDGWFNREHVASSSFKHYSKEECELLEKIRIRTLEAIFHTEFHLQTPDWFPIEHDSTKIMLDVDMAGFARSFDEVYKDSEKIFKEYEALGLPEQVMLQNRIAFLEALLKKDRIYHTDYFYKTHEEAARNNIEAVIELSRAQLDK